MITTVGKLAVSAVALIQLYMVVLQMILWEKPAGLRAFGMSPDYAAATRILGANQGLYNGFLAAGLFWGLSTGSVSVQQFFLGCVLVAGVYAALTLNARALWVQAGPAAVALILLQWA